MLSDFRAVIMAQLDDKSVAKEINDIGSKHKIVFNNISFDRTALSNAIQSALNGQNININLGNANFNTQALASQAQQAGVNAGQNFVHNFNSQIQRLHITNDGNSVIDNLGNSLFRSGFNVNDIQNITRGLEDMRLTVSSLITDINGSHDIRFHIRGTDEYGKLINIIRRYNNETGELETVNARVRQSFEGDAKQLARNEAAITKYLAKLDEMQLKAINPNETKFISNIDSLDTLSTKYNHVRDTIESLRTADSQSAITIRANIESEINSFDGLIKTLRNAEYAASQLRAKPLETVKQDELNKLTEFLAIVNKSGISLDSFKTNVTGLQTMLKNVNDVPQLTQYLNALSNVKSEFKALRQEQSQFANETEVQITINKMETWLRKNSKAAKTYGNEIRNLINNLKQMQAQGGVLPTDLKRITNGFMEIKTAAAAAGLTGRTIFEQFMGAAKSLSRYFSSAWLVSLGFRGLRSMYENVLKVDTAMTDLYRITNLSTEQYTRLYDKMTDSAKKYGVALNDIIAGTANWVRYGFSDTDLSKELAEITAMYQHVADLDNKTATQNLLTAYKGFKQTLTTTYNGNVSSAMEHIADVYDKLNNELPVSAAQVAEGVNKAASVLQEAGTSFEQASALIVGGGSVTQDFDSMGNAIKIATLRIHGMKGKLEELGEEVDDNISSVSKIQTQILNLTHGKVNIFEDDGESFRNVYDVFHDIANVWGTLKDTESAELLETIAGKNRSNQIMALIQNWETVEKAVKAANNATGTAREEQERYMNSLQGHIDSLNASLQATSNTILKSDFLKDLVNLLNVIVNGLDFTIGKLGTIPTLIGTITAVLSAKNFGRDKMFSLKKYAESNNSSVQICTV